MKKQTLCGLIILTLCIFTFINNTQAQWLNANPGHGGQVQHVICDPNEDGKMYLCSDMEGYYVSHDYGGHWEFQPESPFNNVFNIAIAPSNSNTQLMGSTYGVALTKNGGKSWDVLEDFIGTPVAAMAIDPQDENKMYFAPSWLEDKVREFPDTGERAVYVSQDGGDTWTKTLFETGTGNRSVLTINVHPTNGHVIVGALAGLYLSENNGTSWTKLANPSNTSKCLGTAVTADGEWMYAVYERNDGKSGLYVRKYDGSTTWQEIDSNGKMQSKTQLYWRPIIAPSSTSTKHYVMMGTLYRGGNGNENALLEGDFTVSGNSVVGSIKEVFKYTGSEVMEEIGWNKYQSVSRTYDYYPDSWSEHSYTRGAFIMSQQSAYIGDVTQTTSWKCVTTSYVKTLNNRRFYKNSGTASTFNWDMTGYKNYVVQTMADNGIAESYDGGVSWDQPAIVFQGNWNGDAAEVVEKEGEKPLVLVGTTNGFGGALQELNGRLLMKTLNDLEGPSDTYKVLIDGKSNNKKGLGNSNRISYIHSDHNKPERVYLSTVGGAYVTENIFELSKGNSDYNFVKITSGESNVQGRKIMSDPNDESIVYYRCSNGMFKGKRQLDNSYNWTKLSVNGNTTGLKSTWGSNGDFTLWADGLITYLLVTKGDGAGDTYELYISDDQGANFTLAVNKAKASEIRNPDWLSIFNLPTAFGGLVGNKDKFYFTYHIRQHGEKLTRGIAFIQATIGDDLSEITFQDLTGEVGDNYIEFPVARRAKIWNDDKNDTHIYLATMGTGLWKRSLKKPEDPSGVIKVGETRVEIPATINFDASESTPYDGRTITSYSWDFGDGTSADGVQTSHTYSEEGTYIVTLTVTDNTGAIDKTKVRIEAVDLALKSIIVASDEAGFAPLYVTLDGTQSKSVLSEISTYKWYLGDDLVGEEEILNVFLQEAGEFLYELEVQDGLGEVSRSEVLVKVIPFTGDSEGYVKVIKDDLEGFTIQDPTNNGQQWGGLPRYGNVADESTSKIHYGASWGIHASSGYPNASGGYSAFLQPNEEVFSIEGLNVSGHEFVNISFGMMKMSIVDGSAISNNDNGEGMKFEYSVDGTNWTEVSLLNKFTYNNVENDIWYWVELEEEIPSVTNLRIRWTRMGSANEYNTMWRVDDIYFSAPTGIILEEPEVELIVDLPQQVKRNEELVFSTHVTGTASTIEWDFGDNKGIAFGLGPHKMSYSEAGEYTVTVKVGNQLGEVSEEVKVMVIDELDHVSGTVIPSKDKIGLDGTVSYSLQHNGGDIAIYAWDFGDDAIPQTASGPGPHLVMYSELGEKNAKVEVTTVKGSVKGTIITNNVVEVVPAVTGTISADKDRLQFNETVTYSVAHDDNITSYTWSFGEGATPQTAVGAGPHQVTYDSEGEKTVSVKIVNDEGVEGNVVADDLVEVVNPVASLNGDLLNKVSLYPNPAKNYIQINGYQGDGQIQIADIQGRVLAKTTFFESEKIPLNLVEGLYLVKLYNKGSLIKTQKLIIQ